MNEERLRSSRRHRLCDAGSFEFYQQPKQIYKGKYRKLNNNDRAIYTMIYNRFLLSVKNHFVDADDMCLSILSKWIWQRNVVLM